MDSREGLYEAEVSRIRDLAGLWEDASSKGTTEGVTEGSKWKADLEEEIVRLEWAYIEDEVFPRVPT
jgi:hypothetical protein